MSLGDDILPPAWAAGSHRRTCCPRRSRAVTVATPQGMLALESGLKHIHGRRARGAGHHHFGKIARRSPARRAKIAAPIFSAISPRGLPSCARPPAPASHWAPCGCRTTAPPALSRPCSGVRGILVSDCSRPGWHCAISTSGAARLIVGFPGGEQAKTAGAQELRGLAKRLGAMTLGQAANAAALSARRLAGPRRGHRPAATFRQLVGAAAALCAAAGRLETGDARPWPPVAGAHGLVLAHVSDVRSRRRRADRHLAFSPQAGRGSRPGQRHPPGGAWLARRENRARAGAQIGAPSSTPWIPGISCRHRPRRRPAPPSPLWPPWPRRHAPGAARSADR